MSLLKHIIEALLNICCSYFEATLFASMCALQLFGCFENRRNSSFVICIHYMQNIINVTMNSSKTDEYGKKDTLQILKNIERNIVHFKTLNYF